MFRRRFPFKIEAGDDLSPVIGALQLAAAEVPARRIRDLLDPDATAPATAASFQTSGERKVRR
jgi:hypothetical protein